MACWELSKGLPQPYEDGAITPESSHVGWSWGLLPGRRGFRLKSNSRTVSLEVTSWAPLLVSSQGPAAAAPEPRTLGHFFPIYVTHIYRVPACASIVLELKKAASDETDQLSVLLVLTFQRGNRSFSWWTRLVDQMPLAPLLPFLHVIPSPSAHIASKASLPLRLSSEVCPGLSELVCPRGQGPGSVWSSHFPRGSLQRVLENQSPAPLP